MGPRDREVWLSLTPTMPENYYKSPRKTVSVTVVLFEPPAF